MNTELVKKFTIWVFCILSITGFVGSISNGNRIDMQKQQIVTLQADVRKLNESLQFVSKVHNENWTIHLTKQHSVTNN